MSHSVISRRRIRAIVTMSLRWLTRTRCQIASKSDPFSLARAASVGGLVLIPLHHLQSCKADALSGKVARDYSAARSWQQTHSLLPSGSRKDAP